LISIQYSSSPFIERSFGIASAVSSAQRWITSTCSAISEGSAVTS
jgi:hypothetical protein